MAPPARSERLPRAPTQAVLLAPSNYSQSLYVVGMHFSDGWLIPTEPVRDDTASIEECPEARRAETKSPPDSQQPGALKCSAPAIPAVRGCCASACLQISFQCSDLCVSILSAVVRLERHVWPLAGQQEI